MYCCSCIMTVNNWFVFYKCFQLRCLMAFPVHFYMTYIPISAPVSCIHSWNLYCLRLNCIYKFQVWDNDQNHIILKCYRTSCHVLWYIVTNVMPWQPVHDYQCYAMLTGISLATFQKILVPSSSRSNTSRLVLDNKDEDSTILQYFGNSVPVNTVQHTRKTESSMSPLW